MLTVIPLAPLILGFGRSKRSPCGCDEAEAGEACGRDYVSIVNTRQDVFLNLTRGNEVVGRRQGPAQQPEAANGRRFRLAG
jgi:hypothetical protein